MGSPGKEHLIPENTFVIYYNLMAKGFTKVIHTKALPKGRSVKESKTSYKTGHLLKNIHIIKTKIK